MSDKIFLGTDDGSTKAAIDKAAETAQLGDRHVGQTIGGGITPPYPPAKLASFQELNTTHQVAVGKKASREVGFGFELVPHPRTDGDPSEEQKAIAEDFWYGRSTKWKIGPRGTASASPTEVFELARQDWHGIGWLSIELIYSADDRLRGLSHVPADEVRVRKADTSSEQVTRGHGYVQENDGDTVYYGEAGDRAPGEDEEPTYVDQEDGRVYSDLSEVSDPANELLFIPNPSPLAKYYGVPDWVAAIQTMVADQEAQRFNREFFEWDTMGQYFVIVENGKLTEEARDSVREMIRGLREQEGRRVAILEAEELVEDKIGEDLPDAKVRIEQIQQHSDNDMAFADFREMNEHEIAKAHEVPPQLLGRMESANRSNSQEAIRDFTKSYIEPKQERFAGRLYRIIHQQILGVEDWMLSFKTRGAENEKEQAEIASMLIKNAGPALTVNEVREMANQEPIDGAVGEMLMSELGGGGGGTAAGGGDIGQAIEQVLDDKMKDIRETVRSDATTMQRLGAQADD